MISGSISGSSRREVVAGMATGIAAVAGGSALAQAAQERLTEGPAPDVLTDPRTESQRPPFPPQQQDPPGLAGKMTPRPDHGETSYVGSGRLAGRKALITGGDSGMGRAAAIAFAREGADVAFGYLPVEEPDAKEVVELIQAEGRKAIPLPGDIRDEAFCRQLVADTVRELGGLDVLVSNAAMQHACHSLLDISSEQFEFDLQDERLCDVLDHQGGATAS